jgi:uncharacterized membrane protein YeaQ/YmgE (transglycosylase-associated protein family)
MCVIVGLCTNLHIHLLHEFVAIERGVSSFVLFYMEVFCARVGACIVLFIFILLRLFPHPVHLCSVWIYGK